MPLPFQPWRAQLLPASFAGCGFHVEAGGINTGRRIAEHEYAKQDVPFGEDMGRKARRWAITAYCIGPYYLDDRDALIQACETEGPATFVHPSLGENQVNCDSCNLVETREKGGYCQFELLFVEAGQDPGAAAADDTQAQVGSSANTANTATASSLDDNMSSQGGIGSDAVSGGPVVAGSSSIGSSDLPATG